MSMSNLILFGIDFSGILYGVLILGIILLLDFLIHKGKNPYINYDYIEKEKQNNK